MKNIVLIGAPASGKGTIAKFLTETYHIPHISAGKVLNDVVSKKDKNSEELKKYITNGLLVPDDIVSSLIKERLDNKDCDNGYILDGFPRTLKQAEILDNMTKNSNRKICYIFNLSIDEEILKKRIIFRRVCEKCGASYHLISLKPKVANVCDYCHGQLLKRPDDNEETFKKRLEVYNGNLKQLIAFYEKMDVLLISIDGSMGLDKIRANIKKIIDMDFKKC